MPKKRMPMDPDAEKAMKEGRLKGSAAVAIAKLSQEQQAAAIAKAPEGKKIRAPKKSRPAPGVSDVRKAALALVASVPENELEDGAKDNWLAVNRKLLKLVEAVNVPETEAKEE